MVQSIMRSHRSILRLASQRGTAAVEFAILSIVLFLFIFGVMEISRVIFVWSTMTEVTNRAARAAAMTDFTDAAAKASLRQTAMFLAAPGDKLILGGDIGYTHLMIDYLGDNATTRITTLPASAADNTAICMNNPSAPNCIRFVRVRLCLPLTDCTAVPYAPLVSLPGMEAFNINMPYFTAIAPLGTCGAVTTSP
jgi:Flp pilus assembly protein TadG